MEKSEFPSEQRIAELKSQGIAPLSLLSVKVLGFGAVLLSIHLIMPHVLGEFREVFQAHSGAVQAEVAVVKLLRPIALILGVPLVTYLIVTSLWALVQTKFMLIPKAVSINFGRLWKFHGSQGLKEETTSFASVFSRCLKVVVQFAFALGVALAVAVFLFDTILNLLYVGEMHLASSIKKLENSLLASFGTFCIAMTLGAWVYSRYRFLLKHRMTRVEMEQEAKAVND